ncbi:MAG: glycosyltransferase family 4 protein [Bacteroidota bacterium]|nr:glycosyltransferase family 4 protein [Bacteroidota bacterium]
MRNILYLHSSSDLYGSDRSLLRTIRALDKKQYTPFVCLPYNGPLVDELRKEGIETFIFDLGIIRRKLFTPIGLFQFAYGFITALIKVLSIIRTRKIDFLHSNTAAVLVGGVAAKLTGKKHLWHVREIIVNPVIVRKVISFFLHHFGTTVIGVSNSVIDNLAIDQPLIRNHSIVIHNGLEIEKYLNGNRKKIRTEFSVGDDEVLVGMIGRVSHWKGQDLFLNVATEVCKRTSNVTFIAVGSPFQGQDYEMTKFRASVDQRALGKKFIIEEFRSDVKDLLAGFDIFILPSTLPDPFPTTVLEAMATGKPIIANAHGGVVQMVEDGLSGFLVPPNNINAMAARVIQCVENEPLRKNLGNAAYERVQNRYSVSTYLVNISRLYSSNV